MPARAYQNDINHYLIAGVLLSLAVHVLIGFSLLKRTPPPTLFPFTAEIVMEPPSKPRRESQPQIVEAPEAPPKPEISPVDTNLRAEKESRVERQQIHRGDPEAGPAVGPKSQPKVPKKLQLDTKTLVEKFSQEAPGPKPQSDKLDLNQATGVSAYEPFSRPFGSGAKFLGSSGSNDYLPNLPDGDITMLNAKASRFAVFVRRVAARVFSEMRTAGWEVLRGGDINSASDYATVRVIMSPKGEILNVSLDGNSGSQKFDKVLFNAASVGAKDPNPPEGALASDGNIHFIFQSRSWAVLIGEPRTGRPMERRWLLLGTGLE